MESLNGLAEGLASLATLDNLLVILIATVIGLIGGIIPGVSGPMLVVVALPVTYAFDPTQAFVILTVLYATSVYGGMVTAILFRAPGTPESALTVLDGYPMAQQGQAARALGVGILSSGVGAIIATVGLIFLTPILASLAMSFSSAEFFAIALLGLAIVASLSSGQIGKGIFGVGLGILLGTVGNDPMTAQQRLTFDSTGLASGLEIVPVLIGLFAIPEVLRRGRLNSNRRFDANYGKVKVWTRENFKEVGPTTVRSGILGTIIGVLPGAGATTTAVLGYTQAVKFAKIKERFGKGDPRGIAGAESANNAGSTGSLVPLFALGIPGSATTAIMIGAFIMHGFQPGPNLMSSQSTFVYTVFAAILIANILAILLSKPFINGVVRIINIPYSLLGGIILTFCVIGSFSLRNSIFDVGVMLAFGVLGYFLSSVNFPVATIILGFVLGPIAESNFRRALMMAGGDYTVFVTRPITAVTLGLVVLIIAVPIVGAVMRRVRKTPVSEALKV